MEGSFAFEVQLLKSIAHWGWGGGGGGRRQTRRAEHPAAGPAAGGPAPQHNVVSNLRASMEVRAARLRKRARARASQPYVSYPLQKPAPQRCLSDTTHVPYVSLPGLTRTMPHPRPSMPAITPNVVTMAGDERGAGGPGSSASPPIVPERLYTPKPLPCLTPVAITHQHNASSKTQHSRHHSHCDHNSWECECGAGGPCYVGGVCQLQEVLPADPPHHVPAHHTPHQRHQGKRGQHHTPVLWEGGDKGAGGQAAAQK